MYTARHRVFNVFTLQTARARVRLMSISAAIKRLQAWICVCPSRKFKLKIDRTQRALYTPLNSCMLFNSSARFVCRLVAVYANIIKRSNVLVFANTCIGTNVSEYCLYYTCRSNCMHSRTYWVPIS